MKLHAIFLSALLLLGFTASCRKPETKEDQSARNMAEIQYTAESEAMIHAGIVFSAAGQTVKLQFTAAYPWVSEVTEDWLTLQPSYGGAGTVEMVLTAAPNTETELRINTVSIDCRSYFGTFSVSQEAALPTVIEVSSVTLDPQEVTLEPGQTATVAATVLPEDATDKTLTWTSSDASVASVSDGIITAVGEGEAIIVAKAGEKEAQCRVTVAFLPPPAPEAVDMGLSVKWASFNVGATAPEEYGDYYAWGETELQTDYSWESYKFADLSGGSRVLTKYNTSEYSGTIDYKFILEEDDDIAHRMYGEEWRIPTRSEMNELIANCTKEWTERNGVAGILMTSTINGNSLFFPAAGGRSYGELRTVGEQGAYWSSSLASAVSPSWASCMWFSAEVHNLNNLNNYERYVGMSIRPVSGKPDVVRVEDVMVNPGRVEIEVGETVQLEAIVLPLNATDKSVIWSTRSRYIRVSATGEVTGLEPTDLDGGATVEVVTDNGYGYTARCFVKVKARPTSAPVPDAVDLGLPSGTKWASFNVGATVPEEYGDYYAWGETSSKDVYSWDNYQWYEGGTSHFGKYNSEGETLDPADDVAAMKLGGNWKTPSPDDVQELLWNCSMTWTSLNGVAGFEIKGMTGNSIFLPAAGGRMGDAVLNEGEMILYWLSSLSRADNANIILQSSDLSWYLVGMADRYLGLPVRAVLK